MDDIPQFVPTLPSHSLLDVLAPRKYHVTANTRMIYPLGRDNAWMKQVKENKADFSAQWTGERKEASRMAMAKYRASRPEQRANKILIAAILELLRGKEHYGVALAERLGVKVSRIKSILAYMSRAKMIVRDDERKPWKVK